MFARRNGRDVAKQEGAKKAKSSYETIGLTPPAMKTQWNEISGL